MFDDTYILKNPDLADSQDYPFLREMGIRKIENLAHRLWTDYNVHDPGITLLELLCYAITDLGYRTAYEMKDLLTVEEKGVPVIRANFHSALNIFPNCPVTFKDLRKCLIDIRGVRNAWIGKHESIRYCLDGKHKILKDKCDPKEPKDVLGEPLNGLFDVLLEFEDFVEEERIVVLGELKKDDSAGGYINTGKRGLIFKVYYPITFKNVSLYVETTGKVVLKLWRKEDDGTFRQIAQVTDNVANADEKTTIDLNFELEAGYEYLLNAHGSAVKLYRNNTGNFPYRIDRLVEMKTGFDGTNEVGGYYFFFDWEITYGFSPYEKEFIWGALPDPSAGSFMNANNQGLQFTVLRPFRLSAADVFPFDTGDLTICLFDKDDQLLKLKKIEINTPNEIKKIRLNWDIPTGENFKIRAAGVRLSFENAADFGGFPVEIPGFVSITRGITSTGSLNKRHYFFYNWELCFNPTGLPQSNLTRHDIRLSVRDKLHEVRNLCEDFVKIRELEFEKIGVCADIEVRPDVDIEETLARIFYELENHIAPPVNFYTIEELLAKGKTTDEIFEGPILEHGFIDHDEFYEQERRCFFRTSDIIQIIMDVPGVTAVKEISLLSFIEITEDVQASPTDRVEVLDGKKYIVKQEPWILELADLQRFAPDFQPDHSKFFFYKNGLPYLPDRAKVKRLFEEKRARNIRPKLKGHERDLPVPLGEFKNLEAYYPAQNALPENYRVGIYRVPDSEPDLRKAQARQLKAYLMFFEQLLANYLSQLSHVQELFSWESSNGRPARTYFTQVIEGIADLNKIIYDYPKPDYPDLLSELEAIIETSDKAEERKNRFLDHLTGRFAESFSEYAILMYSMFPENGANQLIADKQAFLADYPTLSSARGKAFDYRFPEYPANISGYQKRLYRLLGIHKVERRNFSGQRFDIQPVTVLENGVPIKKWRFVLTDAKDDSSIVFKSVACENRDEICALLDSVLHIGAETKNYDDSDGVWKLFQKCGDEKDEIGSLPNDDEDLLNEVISYFQDIASQEGFHLVEQILLRKRTLEDPFLPVQIPGKDNCDCPCVKDPYSFRASVILPSWAGRFRNIRFRQYVEKKLREEAPAHVYLKICWVNHCDMMAFERCHDEWLRRHARLNECFRGQFPLEATAGLPVLEIERMGKYTKALEDFIEKLHELTTVFATARLHDCKTVSGDEPQISLNNTSLGSL